MRKIISLLCIILVLAAVMTTPAEAAKKDTKAPVITKTDPVDYATDIMIESTIIIRFNEAVQKGKNIAKISLKENETKSIEFTYEITGQFLKLTPKTQLKYDTLYTVTIPASAVKDKAGNNFAATYSFNFLTETDPSKASTETASTDGITYSIEIEATMQEALTPTKIAYFEQMLQKFGINATFKNVSIADQEDQSAGDTTSN
ncbi:MAG TPA: Ig-like domain-containing protein [Mobilitalea sp.]|nr:Ig-like domain-containing protein [Mobilitalea sp.]